MKKTLLYLILLLSCSGIYAQGVYNNGAKIVIGPGTFLNISGASAGGLTNATNVTDGAIALSGTIKLEGNYTNNVAGADILSTAAVGSEVAFTGTTAQTIGGTTTALFNFDKLTVNNAMGLILAKDALVSNTLTLSNGLLTLGTSNLTLAPAATVAGTPSATAMIVATATGELRKQFSAIGSFTYPVGDNNLTAKFSPVTLNFTAGTFAAASYAGVNLVNASYNDPSITGSYLNRYWNISQAGITGFTANALFQYGLVDVVGTEGNIYSLRVIPTPISSFNPTDAVLHQLTANALTAFGTFTGGPGFKTLNLSAVLLQGLYNSLGTMNQAWDAVGPHWPAGVADHINVELHNAAGYATIAYTALDVPLSTTGTATVNIPVVNNGAYYVTVRHRNSLETTTAAAVSFAGGTINQSFGSLLNVYGSNLGLSADGHYLIYGGDVNQDGVIDTRDYINVDNDAYNYAGGYLPTDIDGNGVIDTRDYILIDNNNNLYIGSLHP